MLKPIRVALLGQKEARGNVKSSLRGEAVFLEGVASLCVFIEMVMSRRVPLFHEALLETLVRPDHLPSPCLECPMHFHCDIKRTSKAMQASFIME